MNAKKLLDRLAKPSIPHLQSLRVLVFRVECIVFSSGMGFRRDIGEGFGGKSVWVSGGQHASVGYRAYSCIRTRTVPRGVPCS